MSVLVGIGSERLSFKALLCRLLAVVPQPPRPSDGMLISYRVGVKIKRENTCKTPELVPDTSQLPKKSFTVLNFAAQTSPGASMLQHGGHAKLPPSSLAS